MSVDSLRRVAVFDAELPTGLAFIRSLGRAGIPVTAFSHDPRAMGRYSKFAHEFRRCPSVHATDEFVSWLTAELAVENIDLVAPTSDFIMFNTAEALRRIGTDRNLDTGHPTSAALMDCLLKDRFATALERVGFPTPDSLAPSTLDEAVEFTESFGFPIVAKPRTHVGVGVDRGSILRSHADLEAVMQAVEIESGHTAATRHDEFLGWPLLQAYIHRPEVEVVSVTGCIDRSGEVLAVSHSLKERQWPPGLGVGSHFRAVGHQPFTEHALEAVRSILGHGIFELEVIIDRSSGQYWAIDLNPRAFGQISLDIAAGNDLPTLWYGSATRRCLPPTPSRSDGVESWQMGLPLAADMSIGILLGPDRRRFARTAWKLLTERSVGAAFDRHDLRPGMAFVRTFLRHPGGLIRPFLAARSSK